MCTSVFYETDDHTHFLARTLDFAQEMNLQPTKVTAGQHFASQVTPSGFTTKYRFVGAGRFNTFADGFNELGFGMAALYFNQNAVYADKGKDNAINLEASELLPYALGNFRSVEDFQQHLSKLNVCQTNNRFVNAVMPLHWLLYDRNGDGRVLEITKSGVHLYDNLVGVMTNSPEFPWQLTNLGHYSHLQPQDFSAKKYGNYRIVSDGPGNGALGLPGDYTSTSRFVRTAFLRQYIQPATSAKQGLVNLKHILNSVDIPRGVKINEQGNADYTQYQGFMDLDHLIYYFQPYDQLTMTTVKL